MTPDAIVREFPVELAEGDGRTIDLRVVPYNTVARVADPPSWEPYDEMWMPGAFAGQLQAANRVEVFLNFEHQQGLQGIIGHGAELRDTPAGLEGTFRVHDNADGEKALSLVREGLLRGVSLEAKPMRSTREGGVVQRLKAHLDKVSLVRTGRPAYKDAMVLAVRTRPPEPVPVFDPDLAARLARVGVILPPALAPVQRAAMPEGMDAMPAGVRACTMQGTPGYTGGAACHVHDGSEAGMVAAMAKARSDAS